MSMNRREFIKNIGITCASFAIARCTPGGISINDDDPPKTRLRDCWMKFGWLAEETQDWENFEGGEKAMGQLLNTHQDALDELVAGGELDFTVANYVQEAYREATYHVWRSNAPITCYEPMMVDYVPTSSSQLIQQADLLIDLSAGSGIDPDTVAKVQASIERDIAFLNFSPDDMRDFSQELIEAAGDTYQFPIYAELELEIPPEAAQAANFLVNLLIQE